MAAYHASRDQRQAPLAPPSAGDPLDATDWAALAALQESGRLSWTDLATRLQLSAPGAADRVRRLEQEGVIEGFAALINPRRVGLGILAFLGVTLEHPRYRKAFLDLVTSLPDVQECHHLTGDFDYLLKVRCPDIETLEDLISNRLKGVAGVAASRTMVALSTLKHSARVPLAGRSAAARPGRRRS
jgi:Lrp/AsnC family transcriptional regulator, leucine-responsive regulatory protein